MRRAASATTHTSSSSSSRIIPPFTTSAAAVAARLVNKTRAASSSHSQPAQGNMGPSETSSRDAKRYKEFHDFHSGERMQMMEPDLAHVMQFNHGDRRHVAFEANRKEKAHLSDWEKEQRLVKKFGDGGPGEKLKKSVSEMKRDELQKQQDIDGLPWEVRWKKSLIPTQAEVVQDMRDRFEIWYEDPLVREQEWFLHWKDRHFKAQHDRRIWPQGYTDYLDHYDETGRRKYLPSDEAWGGGAHKALLDSQAQKRLWMADAEERKATMLALTSSPAAIEAESDRKVTEHLELVKGIEYGVIDMDPDAAMKVVSGTADPYEVAKTKHKLEGYAAEQTWKALSGQEPGEIDPVSGMPKSSNVDAEGNPDTMLPSGITIEQAALLEAKSQLYDEEANQRAESAIMAGESGILAYQQEHLRRAKESGEDRPFQQTSIRAGAEKMRRANERLAAGEAADSNKSEGFIDMNSISKKKTESSFATFEEQMLLEQQNPEEKLAERFMAPGDVDPDLADSSSSRGAAASSPEWYREQLVETEPLIESYGLTGDPLEQKQYPDGEAYRTRPEFDKRRLRRYDATTQGESAFDGSRAHKERVQDPKLAHGGPLKPLPKYSELAGKDEAAAAAADDGLLEDADLLDDPALPKSERLRRRRIQRLRKQAPALTHHQQQKQLPSSTSKSSKADADANDVGDAFHPDSLLPDLPWEGDSVTDPTRGLAKTGVKKFDREHLRRAFTAYREFLQTTVAEVNSMNGQVAESQVEGLIRQRITMVRNGDVIVAAADTVGAPLDERTDEVLRIIFEGHMLQILSEFVAGRGASRKSEVDALRSQADDLMRKASAKCKLLGKGFVDFMQELTTDELDKVKKSPYQRYAILVRDKKHLPIVKPFTNWMASDLSPLSGAGTADAASTIRDPAMLDRQREISLKALNNIRATLPLHAYANDIPSDSVRTALADAAYHWCHAALEFFVGKQFHELALRHSDTRFRHKGDELCDRATDEWNGQYLKASQVTGLTIPIPHSEPISTIDDSDFLSGDSGCKAELRGELTRAEEIYKMGVTFRWYGEIDETEYMHYLERRGLIAKAMEVSDRSLEAMNKKTHPSVFPFPGSAARPYLEGAPLTQETAEHLWLRMMGEMHLEHADFNARIGRNRTSTEQRQRGIGMLKLALSSARDKNLPTQWRAPLMTQARLLCNAFVPPHQAREHLQLLETTLDEIVAVEDRLAKAETESYDGTAAADDDDDSAATSSSTTTAPAPAATTSANRYRPTSGKWITDHWMDRKYFCDIKAAMVLYALPVYHQVFMEDAAALVGANSAPDAAEARDAQASRVANGGQFGDKFEHVRRMVEATDVTAGSFRRRMIALRDREHEKSDPWHMYNMLRFWVRVHPKTEADVDALFAELDPTYDYFYTQTALGNRARSRFLGEILRRMSFVLLAPCSTLKHRELLLERLTTVKERMHAAVQKQELDKAVVTLEAHVAALKKAKKSGASPSSVMPPYTFGDMSVLRAGQRAAEVAGNPILNNAAISSLAGKEAVDYDTLKDRERAMRIGDAGDEPWRENKEN